MKLDVGHAGPWHLLAQTTRSGPPEKLLIVLLERQNGHSSHGLAAEHGKN